MDLTKIFEMQKKLDKCISKEHNVVAKEVRTKRVVALLVEICEFANEYSAFKYWKKSKKINKIKMIEEFVDGLHFFSSLGLEIGIKPIINPRIISKDKTEQLAKTLKYTTKILDDESKKTLISAFEVYLGNAIILEITEEEIFNVYLKKNKINYHRIKNRY